MKKRIVYIVVVILAGVITNQAMAQPEIRYPNPAYLHWEEPCDLAYRYNSGGDGHVGQRDAVGTVRRQCAVGNNGCEQAGTGQLCGEGEDRTGCDNTETDSGCWELRRQILI